jgi:hypothetical protein
MKAFNWKECDWSKFVGPGWGPLVNPIQKYAKENNLEIYDVKQKYGTLNIQAVYNDMLLSYIEAAERLSQLIKEYD